MRTFKSRIQVSATVFTVAVVFVLGTTGEGSRPRAASASQKDKGEPYPKPPVPPSWIGAVECQGCHNEKDPADNPLQQQTRGFEFVRLSENRIWNTHDMHAKAYENIKPGSNATAKLMETNLKKVHGDTYQVTTDVKCLACHATHKQPLSVEPPGKWLPIAKTFAVQEGVGCEMCHGHGKAYQDRHKLSVAAEGEPRPGEPERIVPWREWDPAAKQEWGLVNLRDPAVAVAKCASCHVGNTAEGRFVTHEMYAVGHPPLPPLDLMAYAREQPRHWGLPTEMKYLTDLAKRDPKKALAVFHFRGGNESYVTRRFAESAVAALHAAAVATKQLAVSAREKNEGGLDFAAFDCASCHHDLKYPSDRQARGYTGRPGRPQFRPAPFDLARVVVEHAAALPGGEGLKGSVQELDRLERALADSCARKVFGDPVLAEQASQALSDWGTDVVKKLAGVTYDAQATRDLLARVTDAATKTAVGDPEVAQLYVWAIETLVLELAGRPAGDDPKPPAVLPQLHERLKGTVVTRLRPSTPFYYELRAASGLPATNREPVSDRLTDRMKAFYGFKADIFRDAITGLAPFVPPKK